MVGLRIFDPYGSGNVIFDTGTRNGRYIGTVSVTGSNGSLTAADFSQGTPFYIPVVTTVNDLNGQSGWPFISVSGTTMTWTYYPTTGTKSNCTIIYGVY